MLIYDAERIRPASISGKNAAFADCGKKYHDSINSNTAAKLAI
jgi:hypothetical protein